MMEPTLLSPLDEPVIGSTGAVAVALLLLAVYQGMMPAVFVSCALIALIGRPIVVTTHELGHVVADILVRFRVYRVRFGPLIVDRAARNVTLDPAWRERQRPLDRFWLCTIAVTGRVSSTVPHTHGRGLRARYALSLAGGVGMNAILCVILVRVARLQLWPWAHGAIGHGPGYCFLLGMALLLLLNVGGNLALALPEHGRGTSDGSLLWQVLTGSTLSDEATMPDGDKGGSPL